MKETKAGKKIAEELVFPLISIPTSYSVTLLQITKGKAWSS